MEENSSANNEIAEKGTIPLSRLTTQDLEKLLRKNEELEKSEALYRKMVFEVQDYAIILLDRQGVIRSWNKGAGQIKGYASGEVIGKHFTIFYTPEDKEQDIPGKLMDEAIRTGRATADGWRVRSDHTNFWASVTLTALHDEQNNLNGFSKVTRDLTAKKTEEDQLKAYAAQLQQKNEALRKSEELYHKMVKEVQDYAIILLNEKGEIGNWNAGAEAIKGYREDEVTGKSFKIFYTPEDRETRLPERLLQEARENGKAFHEGWRVRKDGSVFWGSISITALHNNDGTVLGFVKVTRDLTERKRAGDKMQDYLSELEFKNRELEEFAYMASHDLQEPLRKIRMFSDLARKNMQEESIVREYLEKIASSSTRLATLIQSVLDYSRLSRENEQWASTDLNQLLEEVKNDYELLVLEKNAVIQIDALPVIYAVSLLVNQLFTNLVGNALKFTRITPLIRISFRTISKEQVINFPPHLEDRLYTEISVADNGIGFDQQYEKQIYSMFQRLHTRKEFQGSGIGLALCKKIMIIHGGCITAKSEVNKGTTFYVYFPVRSGGDELGKQHNFHDPRIAT